MQKRLMQVGGMLRQAMAMGLLALTGAVSGPRLSAQPLPAPPMPTPSTLPDLRPAGPDPLQPTIHLRGRIEADAILAAQSLASRRLIGELQNGYGFRRARLGAEGTLSDAARYVAEVDFAGGTVRLRDVIIGLTALPAVSWVNVGYFREPFSLEGATSSRFITFLERSPLNQFDPTRNAGLAAYWAPEHDRWNYVLGVFRDGTDGRGVSDGDSGGWALTTRLTALPIYEPQDDAFRLVHLGGALSHRHPAGGTVQYGITSQSNLLTFSDNPASPFLPNVNVAAISQQLYNLQAAVVDGPGSIQCEWFGTAIQRPAAGILFLHGGYVTASYFLTGEHRGYDTQRAGFDRVAVRNPVRRGAGLSSIGSGAVEVAARFAVTNFPSGTDEPIPPSLQTASVLYQTTLGPNWYLNDFTRVMLNYTVAAPAVDPGPTLPVHIFGLRMAVFW
jgi:phosphate-selective porin OprO and OprP